KMAQFVADECAEQGRLIGVHGNKLIENNAGILTHCNAGWLALVDYGSALAPIYEAHRSGKSPKVFVDETRPRSQGAKLTAWELHQEGVEHVVIADNSAAYYMSKGFINICITGADRIARNGDIANKTGTLSRAIAAKYYGIPFYIAAPASTFDRDCKTGNEIIIEQRDQDEVLYQTGPDKIGEMHTIRVVSPGSQALNPAFDVTPTELITAFITEKGVFKPSEIDRYFELI
ncbi:MAG: S-methyl-5-thioribose-1-phosphate isomerase, partial [Bacteroidales bacterium]|nr:S-methyl-5-thioribose-1-phosphate isomerase [Bacteroidales bacterium]